VAKTLRFQKATWVSWIIAVAGTGLNALMRPNSNAGIVYGLRVIGALGAGFLFQLPVYAVHAASTDEDLGAATASITFFRSMGQAFGVAIGGTVFQNQFNLFVNRFVLEDRIPREFIITGAEAAGAYDTIATFPQSVQIAYQYVYADSLCVVWYVVTGIGGIGLLAGFFMQDESMDRGNNTRKGFKDDKVYQEQAPERSMTRQSADQETCLTPRQERSNEAGPVIQ
jgi:hypothetical protein